MRRLFTVLVSAAALLFGSATAQYGYPYGYQPMMPGQGGYYDPAMAGMGYYDPNMYGGGSMDAYFAELMRQGDAQLAAIQQQSAQTEAYVNQALAQINQYYINLYRTTTGDQVSSNEVALYYGQFIHCQQYPADCAAAAQNAAARAAASSAAYDASNDAWWAEQRRQDQAHQDFITGVIRGEGEYTSAAGETQVLPFAPNQNSYYQTPTGLPLVFDASTNTWYQIEMNGTYTPYYGAP